MSSLLLLPLSIPSGHPRRGIFPLCHHQSRKPNGSACQQLIPTAELWNIHAPLTEENILTEKAWIQWPKSKIVTGRKKKSIFCYSLLAAKNSRIAVLFLNFFWKIVSWFYGISFRSSSARYTFLYTFSKEFLLRLLIVRSYTFFFSMKRKWDGFWLLEKLRPV